MAFMGVKAFMCALVAVFIVDSITTYLGISYGLMKEANPLVAHLIPVMSLGKAMIAIVIWKLIWLRFTYIIAKTDETRLWAMKRILLTYGVILGASWLTILL